MAKKIEICNECGRIVCWGSGLFINRVIDFDDYKIRKGMNKPFPKGDYICRECETKINNLAKHEYYNS
ncbi:MAG: hypothetical protein COX43_00805 [Parcubacteria group bacterium CG23_combo_of_CG06-09_8_20_14_all_35_9]|nr:MAG: hypothetical protein COX43_00805 [Parcubacteria group bacterium CG23_combo_of_CG06-09_8_20_14_all_35_9]